MPAVSAEPKPPSNSVQASTTQDTSGQRMKVLMADDSASMRALLEAQLGSWGLDVIAAKDGAEAWELFQQHEMPLVVTDWIMPNVDGLELIRRIRSYTLDHYVYVLLLTAKSDKEDLVQAMDAGADDFLVKPCDNGELRVRLREGTRILKLEQTLAEKNRALRDAQAALVQSEKLAGLGQLAAGMAHEINNPIAFVNNNLSVLRRDVTGLLEILDAFRACENDLRQINPDAADKIQRLVDEHDLSWIRDNTLPMFESSVEGIRRVRDIVRNLREFARLDEADYDTVDLTEKIESTIKILQHLLDEKGLKVDTDTDSPASIHCRPATINQMIHNLLLNAIQACASGDQISVRVRAEANRITMEISDTGVGIAEQDLPKIYEPFYTTRPVGEGTGLGLSFCYGVVRDHGGRIHVESQLGVGTTVRVELPTQLNRTQPNPTPPD